MPAAPRAAPIVLFPAKPAAAGVDVAKTYRGLIEQWYTPGKSYSGERFLVNTDLLISRYFPYGWEAAVMSLDYVLAANIEKQISKAPSFASLKLRVSRGNLNEVDAWYLHCAQLYVHAIFDEFVTDKPRTAVRKNIFSPPPVNNPAAPPPSQPSGGATNNLGTSGTDASSPGNPTTTGGGPIPGTGATQSQNPSPPPPPPANTNAPPPATGTAASDPVPGQTSDPAPSQTPGGHSWIPDAVYDALPRMPSVDDVLDSLFPPAGTSGSAGLPAPAGAGGSVPSPSGSPANPESNAGNETPAPAGGSSSTTTQEASSSTATWVMVGVAVAAAVYAISQAE